MVALVFRSATARISECPAQNKEAAVKGNAEGAARLPISHLNLMPPCKAISFSTHVFVHQTVIVGFISTSC